MKTEKTIEELNLSSKTLIICCLVNFSIPKISILKTNLLTNICRLCQAEALQCFYLCIPISKSRTSGKWSDTFVFTMLKSLTCISSVMKI